MKKQYLKFLPIVAAFLHLFYSIHGRGGYFTQWMKKWVEYPR